MRYHLGNIRRFKEEEARFFLACIVLSLEYLHGKNVIHRDLKPENLVVDDRGYVRVTDLGVSREVKPINAEDTSGTPGYMAPEVICKMNHSFPVDFFALGVIAYEMMIGKVLFACKLASLHRPESEGNQRKDVGQISPIGRNPSLWLEQIECGLHQSPDKKKAGEQAGHFWDLVSEIPPFFQEDRLAQAD